MYKTVNQLAPQRLCNNFPFSNTVNSYNLRGSSTGLFIPRPSTEFLKKVSVIVRLNYGIEYQMMFEIRYLTTFFSPPRPPNY